MLNVKGYSGKNTVDPSIFRAYDIRGKCPEQINEEAVYKIGRALVRFLSAKKIIVGRDNRLTSASLAEAIVKGITDEGADVVDIGVCDTPRMYVAVVKNEAEGGAMITASHMGKKFNGIKFLDGKRNAPIGGESGLKEIEKIISQNNFVLADKKGKVIQKDFLDEYLDHIFKFADISKIKGLRAVVDAGNGAGGSVLSSFFERLDCEAIPLFWDLDGDFPNHSPDPAIIENLEDLRREVIGRKADLGVAFDGDADRIVFIDEKGERVRGDFVLALVARELLKKNPGQKMLYEVRSSLAVKEAIEKNGGEAVVCKAGNTFIKEEMIEHKALLGGECTGHYFLRDNHNFESPLIILLYVLEILSAEQKKFSEIVAPLQKYFQTEEANFEVSDQKTILEKVEKKYEKKGIISHLDGISVEMGDWRFNLRPSQNDPVLRLNLEAETKRLMDEKFEEIRKLIELK